MGIFQNILEKLGIKKEEQPKVVIPSTKPKIEIPSTKPGAPATHIPGEHKTEVGMPHTVVGNVIPQTVVPAPVEIPVVDVMTKLEKMAKANPQELNWKTSIVDLLKLLGIDSSYDARKELAVELGCPEEKMGDSAQMNMWLHKTVIKKIAENGGNIPKSMLD
ncbi:MAG TPA: DUF3597 domain-containing protein [Anaerolineaceae bacterium]|nr:DUF3597 domain-containing protein [Anaerolineaceae bacterium]